MNVLERLAEAGCVAVLRSRTAGDAERTAHALAGAGVRAVEVTFTVPGAASVVERLRADLGDGVLVGCGTVTSARQVGDAVRAGAQFLVSPGLEPGLGTALAASGLPFLPGVLTPSEVMSAVRLGAVAVKLFPASTVGPGHLDALRGPFPDLAVVPTGGIGAGSAARWIRAGALAVGAGGALAPPEAGEEDLRRARAAAGELLREIRAARCVASTGTGRSGDDASGNGAADRPGDGPAGPATSTRTPPTATSASSSASPSPSSSPAIGAAP